MTSAVEDLSADIHAHRILILDFGAQYTQLIARRVRESGVYCEILPWDIDDAQVRRFGARGIILSGGPESVIDAVSPRAPSAVFELAVPVLGICYGMQTMAQQLGGRVAPGSTREFGYAEVRVTSACRLLDAISDRQPQGGAVLDVWMSHGDRVETLPNGFRAIGSTADAPYAAMADDHRRFYGVQFHPEVTHTRQGVAILERFVREICGCDARWTASSIIDDLIARVHTQVGAALTGRSRLIVIGPRGEAAGPAGASGNPGAAGSQRDAAIDAITFEAATDRYDLVIADPASVAVPRLLTVADQLILVAPASAAAPAAIAMTFEWLEAHGQSVLATGSIMVLNGVSRRSMSSVEQAERVCAGRCRAIVKIPWDDQLQGQLAKRVLLPGPSAQLRQHWTGVLRPATAGAYAALAGVLVVSMNQEYDRDHEPAHAGQVPR